MESTSQIVTGPSDRDRNRLRLVTTGSFSLSSFRVSPASDAQVASGGLHIRKTCWLRTTSRQKKRKEGQKNTRLVNLYAWLTSWCNPRTTKLFFGKFCDFIITTQTVMIKTLYLRIKNVSLFCVFLITEKARAKGGDRYKVSVLWKTKSLSLRRLKPDTHLERDEKKNGGLIISLFFKDPRNWACSPPS